MSGGQLTLGLGVRGDNLRGGLLTLRQRHFNIIKLLYGTLEFSLGSTPNSLAAAFLNFFSAVSTAFRLRNAVLLVL